jgi:hypothetical protein
MKFILIIALAAVVFAAFNYPPPSKEPVMYLGHAQYQNTKASWCVVRAIKAVSHKQADSLFMVLVDSCVKADKGTLIKNNYDVWELEDAAVLKINHEHDVKLKAF